MATMPAQATCVPEPYIGSLCLTAGSYCPKGYVQADGQYLEISQFNALFAYMGTTYGGDGRTTFKVPDLRGRSAVSYGSGIGLTPIVVGQYYGTEVQQMNLSNLPAHTHLATFTPSGEGDISVDIPVSSNTSSTQAVPDTAHSYLAGSPSGGGTSAAIWSDSMTKVTSINGVTAVGGGSGTVEVAKTGENLAKLLILPPRS
ncbi:MAG: tail fiber protein [gamma proteobacterium symbiont of Taylorina sp.]|nr:tail fiber protein [gamma proteobacterium symbiont of Taylorina sp.]